MTESGGKMLTVPRFKGIAWLVHGFGTRKWKEADFSKDPRLRQFRLVLLNQVHADTVHIIRQAPRGELDGDALVTDKPGFLLAVKTADCLPVLLLDQDRKAVAAVHCGWRSTRKKILRRVVGVLEKEYSIGPADLVAAFGPCIGPDCYEVGEDVRVSFKVSGFPARVMKARPAARGKYLLDLRGANLWVLEEVGLRRENILSVEGCTHCDSSLLSYRRDGDKDDRMFNFIGIR